MSAAERTRDLSVGDVLLGDSPDADDRAEVLTRSFGDRGVVRSGIKGFRHLSGAAMRVVTHQLAEVILQSLDLIDVKDLLVGGWRKHKELIEAAARTRAVAGSEELVALAAHHIASTHQPSIDLIVKGNTVHTCVFDLGVKFDINGVLAVVRQGELTALRGGTCLITAHLALGEVPLVPPQQRRVDLAKLITLNPPVRLPEKTATGSGGSDQVAQDKVVQDKVVQ
ncbi:MAG: hypothetical protein ABR608_08130 [Pseudonocardiaceae bacterium]